MEHGDTETLVDQSSQPDALSSERSIGTTRVAGFLGALGLVAWNCKHSVRGNLLLVSSHASLNPKPSTQKLNPLTLKP